MKRKGKDLEFISYIESDGRGTCHVAPSLVESMKDEKFEINCLSISNKTFIASGFSSFVVKLKK